MTLKQKFFLSLKLPSLFIQITRYITSIYTGKILMFVVSGTWMSSSLYHRWVELFVVDHSTGKWILSNARSVFSGSLNHTLPLQLNMTRQIFSANKTFRIMSFAVGDWISNGIGLLHFGSSQWVLSTRSLLLPVYMALIHVSHHTNSPPFQTEILRSSFEPFSWIKTCAERGEVVQFWTA